MNIEQQVCTFEQAKRLKELGVVQESVFAYIKNNCHNEQDYHIRVVDGHGVNYRGYNEPGGCCDGYAAYTVAELGQMIADEENGYDWNVRYVHPNWCLYFDPLYRMDTGIGLNYIKFKTEAEARATMLITLLESQLIAAEQINGRLTQ